MYSTSGTIKRRSYSNFNSEWELMYFCQQQGGESECVICKKRIICKAFNIKRHYETYHSEEYSHFDGEERKAVYEVLYTNNVCNEIDRGCSDSNGALRASYHIALEIVRANTPLSSADVIKKCILIAANSVSNEEEVLKFEKIKLSRSTISRRIAEMAENVKQQLKEKIQSFVAVSLAICESTDIAQLAIFVRGVDSNFQITEELLDVISMKESTTGNIFKCVEDCALDMGIPWGKLVWVGTDGSKAMTGCKLGLISLIREKLKREGLRYNFTAVHCLIHQEALCAKSPCFKSVLSVVVKCVNILRAHGKNHIKFQNILELTDGDYNDIPNYGEVRWLSRGAILQSFFELRDHINVFLDEKQMLIPELRDLNWISDLAFISDITRHLNDFSLSLMGKNKLISNLSDDVTAFRRKLDLFKHQLEANVFTSFPCLQTVAMNENILKYVTEINNLKHQFEERFSELETLKPQLETFELPFDADPANVAEWLQLEIIDLQSQTRLKGVYKDYSIVDFYMQLDNEKFPKIRIFAASIVAMFGTTYSCEQFFSTLKLNKSRLRYRSSESNLPPVLRLASTNNIEPDIESLISSKL